MSRSVRVFYAALGCVAVVLALVGVFLPLMPTTIFVLLAGFCFARSSPRLEAWLLAHSWLGPPLVAWRETGAVSRGAKRVAVLTIGAGFAFTVLVLRPGFWTAGALATILAAVISYITSRPDA